MTAFFTQDGGLLNHDSSRLITPDLFLQLRPAGVRPVDFRLCGAQFREALLKSARVGRDRRILGSTFRSLQPLFPGEDRPFHRIPLALLEIGEFFRAVTPPRPSPLAAPR